MKTWNKATALLMIMCISAGLHAQITISSSDFPGTGDTLRYSTATNTSQMGYDFQVTGANHNWDFSNLMHAGQDVDTFVSVTATPIFYYPSFITNATHAKKGQNMAMGTFSLSNVYDFYKKTTGYYSHVGFAAALNGLPIPTLYSSPDYEYRFPLSYGNSDSCDFGYNITIPSLFSYHNQSKRVNTVDGWGTITTPMGTFQAIRIKSVITSRDSVVLDSLPLPFPPTTSVSTEYKWLANGYKMPILSVTQPAFGLSTVAYMDTYKPIIGIRSFTEEVLAFTLWPNPASESVNVQTRFSETESIRWFLHDLSGRNIQQGEIPAGVHKTTIDLADLEPGVYALILSINDQPSGVAKVVKQ